MSEPTLALGYDKLRAEIGAYLGFGRGTVFGQREWTTAEQNEIQSCLDSGVRRVVWPDALEGEASPYEWSWLKPRGTFSLASGASTVRLPDDFGGVEGELTYTASGQQGWYTIPTSNPGDIDARYAAMPTTTGRPMYAAVRVVRGTTASRGQRWELYVWPLADAAYTFAVPYYLNPDALTAAAPYPPGGPAHAETYLESCLAIAEQRQNDMAGVHTLAFKDRLRASVAADRKLKPQNLGYNRDRSDERDNDQPNRNRWLYGGITVNGVQY